MNNLPQIFNYQQKQVRTVFMGGEPYFVAKDICEILNINDARTVIERLDEDEWDKTTVIDSLGRGQEAYVITESGLYEAVGRSNKKEAKPFQRWVRKEVLPSIRKHGMYAKDELLDNPDLLLDVITKLKQEREEKKTLQAQNEIMKPKAEFFDAVAGSKDAIDVGQAAKVLNFGKGRTTLFKILREEKILDKDNIPYQEYIDRGYFRTVEQKYSKPDGSTHINIKTLVYQKGLDYIRKILKEKIG